MARLHESGCFVVGVVGHVGCHVKLLTDAMATVSLVDSQSKLANAYPFSSMYLVITLPTSRYMVPGLQISKAFCRHSYDLVTRNLLDSETSPTKYVSFRSMWQPCLYTVTSRFTMSPLAKGRLSGMPWQMTSLTDVHSDLGNWQQLQGEGQALFSIMQSCTFTSISSVVTPAFTRECPKSRVFLARMPTSRIISISFFYLTSIYFWNLDSCSFLGTPVQQQSGFTISSGMGLFFEITPGLRGPLNLNPEFFFACCSSLETWHSLWTGQVALKHS